MMVNLKTAVLRGADAIDARSTFDPETRAQYLNASEALTCIRKQWYSKNDAEQDGPQNWGYARRGKHGEKYIVEALRAANVPMLFTGDDQVAIRDDDLRISCTPDGLVWDDDLEGWVACEFKTIDPRTNRSNLPKAEHVAQVQIAAAMFDKHADEFPELKGLPIVACRLLYMNASDYNDIEEMFVPLKHSMLDALKGRANRVLDTQSPARLPREGAVGTKAECKQRCAFNGVCGADGAGSSTGQGRAGAGDMSVQVKSYIAAKQAVAMIKEDQDKAAEQIKVLLKREGVTAAEVDGHRVTLSMRAGSVSYAKVVKDHCPSVDLEPYRGSPSEILKIE